VLDKVLKSLARSSVHVHRTAELQSLATPLLIASRKDDLSRLEAIQVRLLRSAGVIPLDSSVWLESSQCEHRFGLSPQDALVCASILFHLKSSGAERSCFLTRDHGFHDPNLMAELSRYNCKLLSSFEDGFRYISRPR
jgi:predicted RNase H-like nuclease